MSKTTGKNTSTSDIVHHSRSSLERSQGRLNVSPPPPKAATKAPPRNHPKHEKRISIDLMPMSLEEIEWAMEDCKVQEEEREIQEIRERIKRRKAAKKAAAMAHTQRCQESSAISSQWDNAKLFNR